MDSFDSSDPTKHMMTIMKEFGKPNRNSDVLLVSPEMNKSLEACDSLYREATCEFPTIPSYKVIESPNLEKQKSGKYILPNGTVVKKSDVKVSYKFYEYGEEDIPYLLLKGLIKEEYVDVAYAIDTSSMKYMNFIQDSLYSSLKIPHYTRVTGF